LIASLLPLINKSTTNNPEQAERYQPVCIRNKKPVMLISSTIFIYKSM